MPKMGRKPLYTKTMSETIMVRMSSKHKRRLNSRAKRNRMSASAYARQLILESLGFLDSKKGLDHGKRVAEIVGNADRNPQEAGGKVVGGVGQGDA